MIYSINVNAITPVIKKLEIAKIYETKLQDYTLSGGFKLELDSLYKLGNENWILSLKNKDYYTIKSKPTNLNKGLQYFFYNPSMNRYTRVIYFDDCNLQLTQRPKSYLYRSQKLSKYDRNNILMSGRSLELKDICMTIQGKPHKNGKPQKYRKYKYKGKPTKWYLAQYQKYLKLNKFTLITPWLDKFYNKLSK